MTAEVTEIALTVFLPYVAPIVFVLLAAAVADRLREIIQQAFDPYKKTRRT